MMNLKIQSRILAVLLLTPFILFANDTETSLRKTKERTIKETFNVNSDATVKINNSYGNIDVVTWDENRVEFDVTIKVTGNNMDKIEDRLKEIDVKFSASEEWVAAETQFGNKKKSWWNWGSNNKLKIEVNYRVKMPMSNNVIIDNDYGAINLDKLEGVAKLNCDYGKISTKELMADNNVINFDYSNNCYFEYIKSGKISADYSGFTVSKSENIELNADYTTSVIEATENIIYNCDYGSLRIDNVNNVEGNADYLSLRLGNVFKNVNLKADYGSIKIDRLASNAGNVNIKSDYTGITIGHDSNYNFKFNIILQYASLRSSDDFNFINKEVKSSSKKYYGYYGSGDTNNLMSIDSDYGSVTFKKI